MIFGKFPIDVHEFARSFIQNASDDGDARERRLLQELGGKKGKKTWTQAIKGTLKRAADEKSPNYETLCHSLDGHSSCEFMLDLVWWDRSSGEGAMLACESELDKRPKAIGEDFHKLLSFKAPLKLMVFGTDGTDRKQQEVIEALSEIIRLYNYHVEGETYLLIDLCSKPEERQSQQAWALTIQHSGHEKNLSFSPLSLK